MNLSEFSAWFEGFTENIDGTPNKKQWARIKKRVDEITPDPTPYPVFIDRYVRPIQPYWYGPTWTTCGSGSVSVSNNLSGAAQATSGYMAVTSSEAFEQLGQAEFAEVTA